MASIFDNLSEEDKKALADFASKDHMDEQLQKPTAGPVPLGMPSTFADTGRQSNGMGEQLDSVMGAPVRQGIHQALTSNNVWDALKQTASQVGKDPKTAPTGYDIASKDMNIENPYLGTAAATATDLAQLPMGEVPGIAGKVEDVMKIPQKSDLASAIEKLKMARMNGETVGKQTGVDMRSWNELMRRIKGQP